MKAIVSWALSARPMLLTAFIACCAACGPKVDFVQTDPTFTANPGDALPPAYIDQLPERPFHSVGVIEVVATDSAQSLRQLVDAARQKAMALGCDAVIEHRPESTGVSLVPNLQRWVVELTPPLRVRRSPASDGLRAQPLPLGTTALAYVPQPIIVPVAPMLRREFLCVLFDPIPTMQAPPSAVNDTQLGLGPILWSAFEGAACGDIAEVLLRDAHCVAEQCTAPLALAEEFLVRCGQHDAAEQVDLHRERWASEARAGATCVQALKRALKTKEAAANYAAVCLKDRKPSAVEAQLVPSNTP